MSFTRRQGRALERGVKGGDVVPARGADLADDGDADALHPPRETSERTSLMPETFP